MSHIVIVGIGRSGLGVVEYLIGLGKKVIVTDIKLQSDNLTMKLTKFGIQCIWGRHPFELLNNCEEVILSPGVNTIIPFVKEAIKRNISVIGELELGYRALKIFKNQTPLLAITGTNGKSTTTDWTAHILNNNGMNAVACGNLGTPFISAVVANKYNKKTHFVVECSSYQLETIKTFHANASVVLNITPDHLARHISMQSYSDAKNRIFQYQTETDLRILPMNSNIASASSKNSEIPIAYFGWQEPKKYGSWCDKNGDLWLKNQTGIYLVTNYSKLLIPGSHNIENAMVSTILADYSGVSIDGIKNGLHTYSGLKHRINLCGERNNIKVYNDSKGTNVSATLTAIRALSGPIVLILGGQDKGVSYDILRDELSPKLRSVIFLGEAIPRLENDLGDLPHKTIFNFDEAVEMALKIAKSGDQVLLSPACASFDQFINFEERGERFEKLVKEWMSK